MTKQKALEILKDAPERVQHVNLIYALQDVPYGIQGVANNVDQLVYSLGQLRQQTAAMTAQERSSGKPKCDCLSYNQPKPDQRTPEVILEAPEWSARKTICVDACIAHVIAHLWENGVITRGCCCGHGKRRPSVVLGESQDPARVPELIAQVDDREWDILQWVLVRPLLLTEGIAVEKI